MLSLSPSTSNFASSFLPNKLPLQGNARQLRPNCSVPSSIIECAVDTPHGGNVQKFPRISVWDPYRRLGVSYDASVEELWGSRNFLLQQYAGHERSEEAIEAAFEKILMASFRQRKKTKINLKSRLKKKVEESPPWVQNLLNYVELPATDIILRRLFLFAFMGGWSIMNSAESGPAFQVAISLAACIYFLNEKMKSLARASITGFGALVGGWICGLLLVPNIPSMLVPPTWTLELSTSLVVSGVDSIHESVDAIEAAKSLAKSSGAIVAVSGAIDIITDGEQVVGAHIGVAMMQKITATGCSVSSLITAFLAVDKAHALDAAVSALSIFGVAGELGMIWHVKSIYVVK